METILTEGYCMRQVNMKIFFHTIFQNKVKIKINILYAIYSLLFYHKFG